MPNRYRGATTQKCSVCEKLLENNMPVPILKKYYPQQLINQIKSAPVHNWFFFVLGFSPSFVDYIIQKKKITKNDLVLDPFVGSGTTLVECKRQGINSVGVDANDFFVFASKVKTTWDLDVIELKNVFKRVRNAIKKRGSKYRWSTENLSLVNFNKNLFDTNEILEKYNHPKTLREGYISPKPLAKLLIIKDEVERIDEEKKRSLFTLALASILVPSSNVRFGPGFGLKKPVNNIDAFSLFTEKVKTIIDDLEKVQKLEKIGNSNVIIGDSRNLSKFLEGEAINHVITSPPYPADHDYTRQTRLQLAFLDFAHTIADVRTIKKRMLTCSTRNVYVTDDDRKNIKHFDEITELVEKIEKRVKDTNGTSGFEKLYGKLVAEYFGGMYLSLKELYKILPFRGSTALLVGDTHAFKMVHIETAKLLALIAKEIGFSVDSIDLWKIKRSTSHALPVPEHILNLSK